MKTDSAAIRYEDLEPRLQSGDLMLFHGASRRSKVIEAATHSEFSHIGMIVRDPSRSLLLWQTDPRPVAEDVEEGSRHPGAQLNDLRTALSRMTSPDYGDTPFVRQLIVERGAAFDEQVQGAIATMEGKSFPSIVGMIEEWLLGHLHVATSKQHMYCAEVVAAAFQSMGLLPEKPPANSYWPRDFSAQHERLPLLRGARLGPQMQVL